MKDIQMKNVSRETLYKYYNIHNKNLKVFVGMFHVKHY